MRIPTSLLVLGLALAASACTYVDRQPAPAAPATTVITPAPQAAPPSAVVVRPY